MSEKLPERMPEKYVLTDNTGKERTVLFVSERLLFSVWTKEDLSLARTLWGDPAVTRYICASGTFSGEDIVKRLETEISNFLTARVQYFPLFMKEDGAFTGCAGLRPASDGCLELGFHLRPSFWGQGLATEAARAAALYAFDVLGTEKLFAGHNPSNTASARVLGKIGFRYVKDEFYAPTGLYHPSYELTRKDLTY